jgi:hypothetical protein
VRDAGIEPGTAALQSGATLALSQLSHHNPTTLRDSLTRFQGMFLVQLDSSDIATPDGMGSFLKNKSI